MTEWECQREREEFARAARAQQPLAISSLASRFTKEQGEGQGEEPREGETRRSEVSLLGCLLFGGRWDSEKLVWL